VKDLKVLTAVVINVAIFWDIWTTWHYIAKIAIFIQYLNNKSAIEFQKALKETLYPRLNY
jgi:hypothetical protein